jgi:hypothetical protein
MAATTKRSKRERSKIYLMTKISILVIFPLVLMILPANFFDNGHYTICIFKLLTDKDCYGCGMSRACMHLVHFDIKGAAFYNKLSFAVLPVLGGLLVSELVGTLRQYQKLKENRETKDF